MTLRTWQAYAQHPQACGCEPIESLADSPLHIVAGHDPMTTRLYRPCGPPELEIVSLTDPVRPPGTTMHPTSLSDRSTRSNRFAVASLAGAMVALAVTVAGHGAAHAQGDFAAKPVTLVIPFPPAGSTDVLGRLLAQALGKQLQQTVVVENVGGAGGTIGAARVARAQPDGYTLLFHNMAQASAPALYAKLPYDPVADFEPIGIVTEVPMILVARKTFPADNLQGILAYAKANPDKLNFANAGIGATSHLCEVMLKSATGAKWASIPYKGTGPALNDMLGGQVDLICDQPASTLGHIKAGSLKPIAVATAGRLKSLPAVPTLAESGLAGFELAVWHGLYAPKGTPKAVIDKLALALQQALQDPGLVKPYQDMSAAIATQEQSNPQALGRFLKADVERWKAAMKNAGIAPE